MKSFHFVSESAAEGHPDKLLDKTQSISLVLPGDSWPAGRMAAPG